MGEATRRGTFAERKADSIRKKKEMVRNTLRQLETPDPVVSEVDRQKIAHAKIAMLAYMAHGRRIGLSAKEIKRRLKKNNKKRVG